MNKELSDRVWSILPKEFKEEVKKEYYDCKHCNADACAIELETVFGKHNLTSDAEGEEMLTCDRDVVRMLYDRTDSVKVRQVLEGIFGSKCLMDKEQIAENANCTEPKPSESTTFNIEHKDIVALHYDLIKLEKSVRTVRKLIDKIYKK